MIKNEKQYRITKGQVDKFTLALQQLTAHTNDTDPLRLKLRQDALRSQLDELLAEVQEYEALRDGKNQIFGLISFDELPKLLIKSRIASGLSQKGLAERLGLKEQQIQRYEATDYASASLERLKQIIGALGVEVQLINNGRPQTEGKL
jgi:DNA-binding XRE family transcriptional regulator